MTSKKMAAGLVFLFVVSASGCSSSPKGSAAAPTSPAGVVLAAAGATQKAGSWKMSMAIDFRAGDQSFAMSGDGMFDYLKQIGTISFTISGEQIPAALGGYQVLFDRGLLYMKFPATFAQIVPGLKPWIKVDPTVLAKQQGVTLPGLNSFAGEDPTSMLAFTRGASNVRSLGSENVRGTQTTHYSMTVDLSKALDAAGEAQKKGIQAVLQTAGAKSLPMEVWVDGEGRVRRVQLSMDVSKLGAAAGATQMPAGSQMTMTLDLFDFGTNVALAPPAPSQVSDFSALQKLSGSS